MSSITLMLGTAQTNITPREPVQLAGFGHREGEMQGVTRDLYIKTLLVQTCGTDGEASSALIVSADLIWWGSERMERIFDIVQQRWGIVRDAVILNASHTHSGPQTSNRFDRSIGEMNEAYVDFLETSLFACIDQAFHTLEPVTMETGRGECGIGINRRKIENGLVIMAPNECGIVDPEVSVVRYIAGSGHVKAVIVQYACHPTTTDQNLVSAEFPGAAMARVEQALGQGATALFLQGCCGDVRPNLTRDGQFYRGDDADVEIFGSELADSVLRVLRGPMRSAPPCMIRSESVSVSLPLQSAPDSSVGERSVPFNMNIVRLSDSLSFLAMNGEVVTAYGAYVKDLTGGLVIPLGYSNGMIGYVPTASQIAEGGYEAVESQPYFGLPAAYSPVVEQIIKNGIERLVQN